MKAKIYNHAFTANKINMPGSFTMFSVAKLLNLFDFGFVQHYHHHVYWTVPILSQ